MKKKINFAITLALILIVGITSVAFAQDGVTAPGVAGIFIDPIADIETTPALLAAGIVIPVGGYVQYITGVTPPNPRLTEFYVTGQVYNETTTDWDPVKTIINWDSSPIPNTTIRDTLQGRDFTDPAFDKQAWSVNAIGTYRVYVEAVFTQADDFDEFEEFTVSLISAEFTVAPMAAPAVAAHILRYNGQSFLIVDGHGRTRTQTNIISVVAHEMEPQTDFHGVEKSVWVNGTEYSNFAYWEAVLAFLNDPAGFNLGLDMPDEDFFAGL